MFYLLAKWEPRAHCISRLEMEGIFIYDDGFKSMPFGSFPRRFGRKKKRRNIWPVAPKGGQGEGAINAAKSF